MKIKMPSGWSDINDYKKYLTNQFSARELIKNSLISFAFNNPKQILKNNTKEYIKQFKKPTMSYQEATQAEKECVAYFLVKIILEEQKMENKYKELYNKCSQVVFTYMNSTRIISRIHKDVIDEFVKEKNAQDYSMCNFYFGCSMIRYQQNNIKNKQISTKINGLNTIILKVAKELDKDTKENTKLLVEYIAKKFFEEKEKPTQKTKRKRFGEYYIAEPTDIVDPIDFTVNNMKADILIVSKNCKLDKPKYKKLSIYQYNEIEENIEENTNKLKLLFLFKTKNMNQFKYVGR